jgi:hypothetical protein
MRRHVLSYVGNGLVVVGIVGPLVGLNVLLFGATNLSNRAFQVGMWALVGSGTLLALTGLWLDWYAERIKRAGGFSLDERLDTQKDATRLHEQVSAATPSREDS